MLTLFFHSRGFSYSKCKINWRATSIFKNQKYLSIYFQVRNLPSIKFKQSLGRFSSQADRCLTPTNSTHVTCFQLKLNCQIKRRNCPLFLITKNAIVRILQIWNSSSVLVFSSWCVTRVNNIKNKNKPHLNKLSFDFIRLNIKYIKF